MEASLELTLRKDGNIVYTQTIKAEDSDPAIIRDMILVAAEKCNAKIITEVKQHIV